MRSVINSDAGNHFIIENKANTGTSSEIFMVYSG